MWIDDGLRLVMQAFVVLALAVFAAQHVQAIANALFAALLFLFIAKLAWRRR